MVKKGCLFCASRDDGLVHDVAKALSNLNGLEVVVADSGKGLMKKLASRVGSDTVEKGHTHAKKVKLVVIDDDLVDMRGNSVLPHLLEMDPELKVIFVTDNPSAELEMEVRRQGVYFFAAKPLAVDLVRRLVEKALEHETSRMMKKQNPLNQVA